MLALSETHVHCALMLAVIEKSSHNLADCIIPSLGPTEPRRRSRLLRMFRHLRVHQVFGANTDVGKTLFAAALCRASAAAGETSHYLKPVGTGGLGDDS